MCPTSPDHTVNSGPPWRSAANVTQVLTSGRCVVAAIRNPQGQIKGKSHEYSHIAIEKCSFNKIHSRLRPRAGAQSRPADQRLLIKLICHHCQNNILAVAMEIQANFSGRNPTPEGFFPPIHLHRHHHHHHQGSLMVFLKAIGSHHNS